MSADRLGQVTEFRNRLVAYMTLVQQSRSEWGAIDDRVLYNLTAEHTWLTTEYGRLYKAIHPLGSPQSMSSPAAGVTSQDVIYDAISNPRAVFYADIARIANSYLLARIGHMQGEEDERAERVQRSPDTIYRLTSPLFWLGRLWALIRWLWGSTGGRIATALAAVILAIITGIATGWAQAIFTPR